MSLLKIYILVIFHILIYIVINVKNNKTDILIYLLIYLFSFRSKEVVLTYTELDPPTDMKYSKSYPVKLNNK